MPESLLSQSSASNNVTVCAESSPSEQIPKVSEEPNSHDTTHGSKSPDLSQSCICEGG